MLRKDKGRISNGGVMQNAMISPECRPSGAMSGETSSHVAATRQIARGDDARQRINSKGAFRILCTSSRRKIKWGSYQLRCRDLNVLAQRCTKNVYIATDVSYEDMQRRWWSIRYWLGQLPLPQEKLIMYDATIFVKTFPKKILPRYGKIFLDMVDEYEYTDEDIPREMGLILQTERQGHRVFPTHNFSVVPHWYNSYPADMEVSGQPEVVPVISETTTPLRIATVWNTRRGLEPTEGGCPHLQSSNVTYDCIDKDFNISTWFLQYRTERDSKCYMERTLADPRLGPGMLYYDVFRIYDALVVLAKNDTMKLNYGNVQRAISQMRSGVPVLMEIRGPVFEDFMSKYNYTCAFKRYPNEPSWSGSDAHRNYWTFNEAVEQLKNVNVRRDCQRQGLEIVEDYSPSTIGQKFLRAVGYQGTFLC